MSDEAAAAVTRAAHAAQVPPGQVAAAAWTKVRSVLTGEPELPPGPWRSLLGTDTGEATLDGEPPGAVLLRHRADLLRHVDASRVGEYLGEVLRAIAADLDAPHEQHSLLTGKDVWRQLNVLHGELRELPDRRAHELIGEQARRTPEAVAAVLGELRWTYAELDQRANAVANRLVEAGARPGDVVAVLSERTLPWVAAILGILKAGLVYLPVDPAYPRSRIVGILRRSAARLLLAEASVEPIADVPVLPLQAPGATTDPRVSVAADAPAYIYFTSGSTGEPKGAVCAHDGMLNHLSAKIDDLDLSEQDAVCQNAPQCFDISLWQVLAPLLVGGRTVLVPPQVILDVEAFLATLDRERITVLQLVPSYLEVLLGHLDLAPQQRPALRIVCVTGEAISRNLVARWFGCFPDVPLVNAYGATEVSDDTTHEIMRAVPATELVPVGRPVQNVSVYILDSRLAPVPFGAPGQIAFAGRCVGPGYINDPDRSALAFVADPFQPGQRMYLTGDYGRWLPNGHLEFLGRRDEQVKISGMRVEVGEVENTVLRVPGVRSACLVVVPIGTSKRLAAFFTADEPVPDLKRRLVDLLPAHMVPSTVHQLDALPLTENGKVDKAALVAAALRAGTQATAHQDREPATNPLERRLAAAWAEVLNRPLEDIYRTDNFFALGGNSLSAVRLIVKLKHLITLTDLTSNPVLADLAQAASSTNQALLLQALAAPERPVATVVTVPDAAGTALNFQPLVAGLTAMNCALLATELPGHDLARPDEPLAEVAQVAGRLADEIAARTTTPLILWGQGAGAAIALECARRLHERGRPPAQLFLAAATADPTQLAADLAQLEAMGEGEIRRQMAAEATYTELDELKSEREALIERAYRHDTRGAAHFLQNARDGWPELPVPTWVVAGDNDMRLAAEPHPERAWRRFAPAARPVVLPGAGRHFLRTHAVEVVDLLRSVVATRIAA
ncbi:amino acid adenylation domain-containing protein [Micromonospora sp. WMMD1082]|uniref:amino acid adenylation domain-containing protein n=1 Tax=Micromonospora sp. WMMD1082 TaxID=3016104 RepID=UPI0024166BBC|nr:amino acid adenylation domain-containing protein [Micromonospora sp. WMMD1082]MDG4797031.1 amino acid adenylation domain-containing protein [Micromonospora sp. WMMD1082]